MIRKKKKIILISLFCFFTAKLFSKKTPDKEITIVFEGLPMDGIEMSQQDILTLNYSLTELLKILKIPSVGFINEKKISEPNDTNLERRKAILDLWTKNNLTLGNFTYQRLSPNEVTFENYIDDVEKGEKLSREFLKKVGKNLIYFRSPYEQKIKDENKKNDILNYLHNKNYTIVPKTIENDDDIFNVCYLNSRVKDDSLVSNYVVKKYLDHTKNMLDYYESLSLKTKKEIFPQILVLKLNLLNIDVLPYIVSMIQERGYKLENLNKIINYSIYISLSDEQKMLNFWEQISNDSLPVRPKIPIVIEKLYQQIAKQINILE